MRILNFGSLNIDHVYRVPHIVGEGETLAGSSYAIFAGGKGANQSIALARAGAAVIHAGKVGPEGRWLIDNLKRHGADASGVIVGDVPTGHAIIQVDDAGENAIVLFAGANHAITRGEMDAALARMTGGDVLLLQNEINDTPYLIEQGAARGLRVFVNPAPFDPSIRHWPLHLIDTLVVNETEAHGLAAIDSDDADEALQALAQQYGDAAVIVTRGAQGATYRRGGQIIDVPAEKVQAVDTTAAGDTFLGFYLAGIGEGMSVRCAMQLASKAAAICVCRAGAADSIPLRRELKC